jgi:serine protease Do
MACTERQATARTQSEQQDTTGRHSDSASGSSTVTTTSPGSLDRPGTAAPIAVVARNVMPAVVSVETEFSPAATARMQGEQGIPFELPPFMQGPQRPARATGSGFFVTKDGYILTNNHVVAGAQKVTITTLDRRIYPAKIIGHDPSTDVALIKVEGSNFPTAKLGDDSTMQVGDPVVAIGNPFGLNFTVTSGIISAKGRAGGLSALFESNYPVVDFLQTDAVINPGNSGGPLVNMQGEVIGINSAIASPTGVYAGYGFAIPIDIGKIVMNEFRKYGRVRRAILGVSIQDVGPADAQAAGLQEIRGALVGGFSSDSSPAKRAGVKPGDIILAVDKHPIDQVATLERVLLGYDPGQNVTLDVMRFGKSEKVSLTLGEAPVQRELASSGEGGGGNESATARLGIMVTPVTPDVAAQLQLPQGTTGLAVVRVDPSGPAGQELIPQDVITATLNGGAQRPVRNVQDLQRAVTGAKNGVLSLLVYSPQAQGTRVVNIPLGK